METSVLADETLYPDNKILAVHLGRAKGAWDAFLELLEKENPLLSTQWRYYNDGKSWLFKVMKKAKTICWVKVYNKHFRVAFYLGSKAGELVKKSSLDERLKKQYWEGEGKSAFRAIAMDVTKKGDIKAIRELIGIKMRSK